MKVRELFDSPDKWTKGYLSRDHRGWPCFFQSDSAVSFCLVGAVKKCYLVEELHDEIIEKIINSISERNENSKLEIDQKIGVKIGVICAWNDKPNRTFEDVKKLVEELDI